MKRWINSDTIIGLIITIISVFFLSIADKMPASAARFPKIILSILGILSFFLILKGLRASLINKFNSKESITLNSIRNPLIAIALIILYVVLLRLIGFYISTTIYTVLFMLFFREKRIRTVLLTAVSINIFIYLLFVVQLNVRLPQGFLNLFERLVK